jgi:DDE superfamily endonuclease
LLREVKGRIRPLFQQQRMAHSAGLFLDALLGPERRKTGWMRAEAAGDPGPWRQQALLGRAQWDADALRDVVRDYAVETLAEPDAVLVVDETGFLKQGKASCGVGRQYTGSAGKVTTLMFVVNAAERSCRFPASLGVEEVCSGCAVPEAEPLRRRSADSDARVGYRLSVCSSEAASICQRASTNAGRPHNWPEGSSLRPCLRRCATADGH